MSIKNLQVEGNVTSEETVKVTKGDFSSVSFESEGDRVTLRGKITEIITNLGVSQAVGVKMTTPDGQSQIITSMDSPALTDDKGNDRPVPKGAEFSPVYQGRAATV